MSEAEAINPGLQDQYAKVVVGLSLVRTFGTHYIMSRLALNAGVICTGYAIGGLKGLLVATGAELVNQALRSTRSGSATMAAQEDFINRHWSTLSKLPAVQWAVSRMESDHNGLEQAAMRPVVLPTAIQRDFKRTAYETGVRQSVVGPLYDFGKWTWRKLQARSNTP